MVILMPAELFPFVGETNIPTTEEIRAFYTLTTFNFLAVQEFVSLAIDFVFSFGISKENPLFPRRIDDPRLLSIFLAYKGTSFS